MVDMAETDPHTSQPDCDGGEALPQEQDGTPPAENISGNRSPSPTDESTYYITWTVYIAVAVPREKEVDTNAVSEKDKKCKKKLPLSMKAHKVQSSFTIEYKLFPGDTEVTKVDLVMFGPGAKIYKGEESMIQRTWHEGERTWVGWRHSYVAGVNKSVVISLIPHKINVKIWSGKDKKLANKPARCDILRAIRLRQDQIENAQETCDDIKNTIQRLKVHSGKRSNKSKFKCDAWFQTQSAMAPESEKTMTTQTLGTHSVIPEQDDEIDKLLDATVVETSPVQFVGGETSVTEYLPICSAGILEAICNISLDRPLLSDELKTELNPLVITIHSAKSLPSSPVPYHVLQEKCMPVYCQYKFLNLATHRTNFFDQDYKIYFRDVSVILVGLLDPGDLRDFIANPPLQIEVHDRDRKLEEIPKTVEICSTLSSEDEKDDSDEDSEDDYDSSDEDDDDDDENADDENQVTKKAAPKIEYRSMGFNPHGVVNVNLSWLLLGKRSMKMHLPIKCGPPPPKKDTRRSAETPADPIQQGHFYEANSHLKLKVKITCPLTSKEDGGGLYCGPFGRIVYLFDFRNFSVMTKLRSEILRINAAAFNLDLESLDHIAKALSNKKGFVNFESKDLDCITGFHVLDRKQHIFVVEGLRNKALRRLWEAVPMKLSVAEAEQVTVLYNSSLGFFRRIYGSLDLSLYPICLRDSLQKMMKRPLLCIRGRVPQPCFQALSRLSQLCQVRQFKDVVQYDLFPSADMLLSMSWEYGTTTEEWKQRPRGDSLLDDHIRPIKIRRKAALDTQNTDYLQFKHYSQQMSLRQPRDFITEHIRMVHYESEMVQKQKVATITVDHDPNKPAHNYSIQTFNSNNLNRQLLQREMAKTPQRRFTYSQLSHSATLEPGDMSLRDGSRAASAPVWISVRSERSQSHPGQPDPARMDELKKPWKENILHANILEPPLSRDRWMWDRRHEDFQIYCRRVKFTGLPPNRTPMPGDSPAQIDAARAETIRWQERGLPGRKINNIRPHCRTVPEFKIFMGGVCDAFGDAPPDAAREQPRPMPSRVQKVFTPVQQFRGSSSLKVPVEDPEQHPLDPRTPITPITPRDDPQLDTRWDHAFMAHTPKSDTPLQT